MTYSPMPADGATGWGGWLRGAVGGLDTRTSAVESAGGSANAWQFRPETYGAVGNGTTDDTVAIRNAISAATTYASANRQYAEVLFSPKVYLVAAAPVQGGATAGNAILPLPNIAGTAAKVTLALRGVGDTAALPHWLQTAPQAVGAVLKTTRGDGYNNTYGWTSVIGGPAYEQGYGTSNANFTNLCLVIDGLTVQVPRDPVICGVDLCGVAECNLPMLGIQANTAPGNAVVTTALQSFAFGLRMPYTGNNAYCEIGQYSVEGFKRGVILGEHSRATSIRVIYCDIGIAVAAPAPHGISIQRACVEVGTAALESITITPSYLAPNNGVELMIHDLDIENIGLVSDFSNLIFGDVQYNNGGAGYGLIGGSNCRWTNLGIAPGGKTPPTVPASGTALTNPFERDCAVSISGGTVTGINVAGRTLGITSGTVFVPSMRPITLTYTAAPAWQWVAL